MGIIGQFEKMNRKYFFLFLILSLAATSAWARKEKTNLKEEQQEEKLKHRDAELHHEKEKEANNVDGEKEFVEGILKTGHQTLHDIRERTRKVAEEMKKQMSQLTEDLPVHWEEAKKRGTDAYDTMVDWFESFNIKEE